VRAVLDSNVIVSAFLSRTGSPARLIRAWRQGAFELVCTPALLAELERVLRDPKLRSRISPHDAATLVALLERSATIVADADEAPPLRSRDPGDDYLLAVAASEGVALVSGDADLLELVGSVPVYSPRAFLELLEAAERS